MAFTMPTFKKFCQTLLEKNKQNKTKLQQGKKQSISRAMLTTGTFISISMETTHEVCRSISKKKKHPV